MKKKEEKKATKAAKKAAKAGGGGDEEEEQATDQHREPRFLANIERQQKDELVNFVAQQVSRSRHGNMTATAIAGVAAEYELLRAQVREVVLWICSTPSAAWMDRFGWPFAMCWQWSLHMRTCLSTVRQLRRELLCLPRSGAPRSLGL